MSMQNNTIHVESRMVCLHMTGFNEMNANVQKFSEDPQRIQMISDDIALQCTNMQDNVLYVSSKKVADMYKNHLAHKIDTSTIKIICSDKLEDKPHTAFVDRKMNVKNQNHSKIIDYFGVPI
ncbi:MAG: hypothetical protein ACW9W4_01175 [Candidatus Nitrosopumilus sp. bin_7KS]